MQWNLESVLAYFDPDLSISKYTYARYNYKYNKIEITLQVGLKGYQNCRKTDKWKH